MSFLITRANSNWQHILYIKKKKKKFIKTCKYVYTEKDKCHVYWWFKLWICLPTFVQQWVAHEEAWGWRRENEKPKDYKQFGDTKEEHVLS